MCSIYFTSFKQVAIISLSDFVTCLGAFLDPFNSKTHILMDANTIFVGNAYIIKGFCVILQCGFIPPISGF